MNKYRLLIFAVIGLMILNVVLMAALFFGRPGGPPPPRANQGPKKLLIDRLNLTPDQVNAYEILITEHVDQIKQKEGAAREVRSQLYSQLRNGGENVDLLLDQLGNILQEIESIHYSHFLAIKELCTPQQRDAFNDFSTELTRFFRPPPPR